MRLKITPRALATFSPAGRAGVARARGVIFSRIQSRSIIVSIRHGAAAIRPGINPLTRTGLLTADFRLARGPASRRGRCAPGVRGLARTGRRRWTRSGAGTARVPGQITKGSGRDSGELDGP